MCGAFLEGGALALACTCWAAALIGHGLKMTHAFNPVASVNVAPSGLSCSAIHPGLPAGTLRRGFKSHWCCEGIQWGGDMEATFHKIAYGTISDVSAGVKMN